MVPCVCFFGWMWVENSTRRCCVRLPQFIQFISTKPTPILVPGVIIRRGGLRSTPARLGHASGALFFLVCFLRAAAFTVIQFPFSSTKYLDPSSVVCVESLVQPPSLLCVSRAIKYNILRVFGCSDAFETVKRFIQSEVIQTLPVNNVPNGTMLDGK